MLFRKINYRLKLEGMIEIIDHAYVSLVGRKLDR